MFTEREIGFIYMGMCVYVNGVEGSSAAAGTGEQQEEHTHTHTHTHTHVLKREPAYRTSILVRAHEKA
jgi:hypothetical protein